MISNDMRNSRRKRLEEKLSGGGSRKSRVFSGLFLVVAGAVLLLQQMNAPFPSWLFTWPVFLIAAGIFVGFRKKFRGASWLIAILGGAAFLANELNPAWHLQRYTGAIFLMAAGVAFILRPKNHGYFGDKLGKWKEWHNEKQEEYSGRSSSSAEGEAEEEVLDVVSVLGGTKKIVFSKNFKGGDVTSFLSGSEINLSRADIHGRVVLDLTQVLGGTKLIVPTHWDIRPELVSVFGGIEDKRQPDSIIDTSKVLILKGTSVFGGIEIRNY